MLTGTLPHFPTSYCVAFCMPHEPFCASPPDMPACLAWASRRTWHAHAWFNIFHRYKLTQKASRSAIVSERCVSTPCITEIGGNGRSWWRARPSRALDKHGERASVEFKRCAPIPPFVSGQTALPLARTTPAPVRAHAEGCAARSPCMPDRLERLAHVRYMYNLLLEPSSMFMHARTRVRACLDRRRVVLHMPRERRKCLFSYFVY